MKSLWRKVGASVNHYDVVGIPGHQIRVIRRLDHSGEKRWHVCVTVTGEGPTMVDKFIMQVDAEKYIDWLEDRAWKSLEEYDKDLIDFYEKNLERELLQLELARWSTPGWARPVLYDPGMIYDPTA